MASRVAIDLGLDLGLVSKGHHLGHGFCPDSPVKAVALVGHVTLCLTTTYDRLALYEKNERLKDVRTEERRSRNNPKQYTDHSNYSFTC